VVWCAAGGYGSEQGWILPILNAVVVNRLERETIGVVDVGCNCFVTTDGGYEMVDFELKQSDNISMLAIMMITMVMK
jgi:hypothetical protein